MFKDFYNVTSNDLEKGDFLVVQVKAEIVRPKVYRLYRCSAFTGSAFDRPQGQRIYPENHESLVAEILFPAALYDFTNDRL